MNQTRTDNWAKGANNIAKPERLPEGFVRSLVNLDPAEGGQLEMRAQSRKVLDATDMRLAVDMGERVIYVDGPNLGCYSVATDSAKVIGSVDATGEIAGVAYEGQVYLSTVRSSLRTDGVSVKAWAVPAPAYTVEVIDGPLPAGIYKLAVTAFGEDGEESGADPLSVRLTDGQAVRIVSADPRPLRVYASATNGAALFSQGPLIGGAVAVTGIDDSRDRLTTAGLVPMPHCSVLAEYHAMIVGICENCLVFSSPLYPHLMDPVGGFVQYSEKPALIAPTEGGIYVVAGDKTYFVTDLESAAPVNRKVLDLGAPDTTAVLLPDGRAAWFTRYGQAIGDSFGAITLINRESYAPDIAAIGAAGVLEHNGNSMVVTTMRGAVKPNNLATGDFADLEMDQ